MSGYVLIYVTLDLVYLSLNKRALFALFSAMVVAISEAGLFLIWQWRNINKNSTMRSTTTGPGDKKVDPAPETSEAPNDTFIPDQNNTVRRRRK